MNLHIYMVTFLPIFQVIPQNDHHQFLYNQNYFNIEWVMCFLLEYFLGPQIMITV